MQEIYIFIFYLFLIVVFSMLGFYLTETPNKMLGGIAGLIDGLAISVLLWQYYGQYHVTR